VIKIILIILFSAIPIIASTGTIQIPYVPTEYEVVSSSMTKIPKIKDKVKYGEDVIEDDKYKEDTKEKIGKRTKYLKRLEKHKAQGRTYAPLMNK